MSTATQPRTIQNPNDPASEGMLALMQRFSIRTKKGLTKQEGHDRIEKWFAAHPAEHAAYTKERAERNKAQWDRLVARYLQAAREKRGDRAATESQIGGMMKRAFKRPDGDRLKIEMLSALKGGVSGAQANVLIRQADGTYKMRQPAAVAA